MWLPSRRGRGGGTTTCGAGPVMSTSVPVCGRGWRRWPIWHGCRRRSRTSWASSRVARRSACGSWRSSGRGSCGGSWRSRSGWSGGSVSSATSAWTCDSQADAVVEGAFDGTLPAEASLACSLTAGELECPLAGGADLLVEPLELAVEPRESPLTIGDLVAEGASVAGAAKHAEPREPPACLVECLRRVE